MKRIVQAVTEYIELDLDNETIGGDFSGADCLHTAVYDMARDAGLSVMTSVLLAARARQHANT